MTWKELEILNNYMLRELKFDICVQSYTEEKAQNIFHLRKVKCFEST